MSPKLLGCLTIGMRGTRGRDETLHCENLFIPEDRGQKSPMTSLRSFVKLEHRSRAAGQELLWLAKEREYRDVIRNFRPTYRIYHHKWMTVSHEEIARVLFIFVQRLCDDLILSLRCSKWFRCPNQEATRTGRWNWIRSSSETEKDDAWSAVDGEEEEEEIVVSLSA